MGNVVGSNIFNVYVILGVCTLLRPLSVGIQLTRRDIPIIILVATAIYLLGGDRLLTRLEGWVLFLGLVAYTYLQVNLAIRKRRRSRASSPESLDPGGPSSGTPRSRSSASPS
jgi:cation:H+ antiporter